MKVKLMSKDHIANCLAEGIMYAYSVAKDRTANPIDNPAFSAIRALLFVDLELTNRVTRADLDKIILEHYGPAALEYITISRERTLEIIKEMKEENDKKQATNEG